MRTQMKKDKIEEILEFLDETTQEKKDKIFDYLEGRYENLKNALQLALHVGEVLTGHAKKHLEKGLHEEKIRFDETAEELTTKKSSKMPWIILGSVAVGSIVLGALASDGKK